MKKFLATLLAALLIVSSFAVSASAETTVKFWSHQNVAWNASYEAQIAEFEAANPDIKVEYTNFPYADFEAKMQTGLMAGDVGADVYEVWGGWILDFASAGVLSEVPEKFMAELKEDAFAPVLGALQHGGKYYGAPLEFNVEYGGLLMNKSLFAQNGLEYPTTWPGVLDLAKSVAKGSGDVMEVRGLEYATSDNLTFNWLAMILQKGGQYLKEDGSVDFTSPEAVESMKELVSWIKDDHVTNLDSTIQTQGVDGHAYLCTDEAYMVTRGPWVISDCVESYGRVYGEDLDYIAIPTFYEGAEQKWAAETGWSLCVPNNTAVPEAAWKFVEFILSPEVLVRHNIDCAQVPPRASAASDPSYLEALPFMQPLLGILDKAQFIGPFNTDVFKTYIKQMFISLCSDDGTYASVEEACQKLTDDLAANMKIYN